ncbi:type VII secretion target [Actinophytocola sediminis]
MSDFAMVPDDVLTHAGSVAGFGTSLAATGRTGADVDLGIETYGIIGQAFSVHARLSISEMGGSISELASALPEIADALRDSADSTKDTDDEHARLFEQFMEGTS